MNSQLYIISAPSGAGKTSLVSALVDTVTDLFVSVSHTTRAQRPGEIDGVNYHFIDTEKFDRMVAADQFLEYARVFDHAYGTARSEVDSHLEKGADVILEIDWQGARQAKQRHDNALSIFILPPSYAALEQRLKNRGQDDDQIVARRMRDAVAEMSHFDEFDYLIINDDFDTALSELRQIILTQRLRLPAQQEKISALLRDLLEQ